MTREEYEERLDGNTFKDDILPIFDFFEIHLDDEKKPDLDYIINRKNSITRLEISNTISNLLHNLYIHKREILISYCWSLLRNVQQFEKMDNDENVENRIIKWKKCLLSYINLSRVIIDEAKIEECLAKPTVSQKIVLCVSTIKLENDDIRVNEEIADIQETNNLTPNSDYLVLPIHGCSFDQFKTRLKKNHITHIHIAGHANSSKLFFSDAPVKYDRFCNHIQQLNYQYELLFLNCCQTFEYLLNKAFPYSNESICHETDLDSTIAIDASQIFYTELFNGLSIKDSWNGVLNSLGVNSYHLL